MTFVLLLRHGELPQQSPRRFIGQRDVPLSDAGRAQALRWREFLPGMALAGVWTSSLSRCVETSHLALDARAPAPVALDTLREISLGAWEGLTVEEVRQQFPGEYERRGADLERVATAGGESFAQLRDRVWPVLQDIVEHTPAASGPLLVVAHAGVNRVLMAQALGMPLARVFSLGQQYAALNVLRFVPGRAPELLALNLPPQSARPLLQDLV
ncbi:MAG: hypothetical protein AUJ49_08810 [Desulfovibrionaceae bacterium CG1_02_65_16]|nr:MAG: hypothetical protein AUJ49_08810 [Desulfovibrionaceae bacterium CG1_02_65_16]